ncbi:sialate O-acetylesterase [Candidatus Hydrogenedentota bacterium]
MVTRALRLAMVGLLLLSCESAFSKVKPHELFADGAVLQRDMTIPIWGTADPGEEVVVRVGPRRGCATAGDDGRWMVKLKPLSAGGPYSMEISGKNAIVLDNILVGEVWVCSGQSNMGMNLLPTENGKDVAAKAANPRIRLLTVPRRNTDKPLEDIGGARWVECAPESAGNFSAVGYFFGRELEEVLDVPIGLLDVAQGNSRSLAWIHKEALEANPKFKPALDEYAAALKVYPKKKAEFEKRKAEHQRLVEKAKREGVKGPGKLRGSEPMGPIHYNRPSCLYYGMIAPIQPYAIRGVIWYQGESDGTSMKNSILYRDLFPTLITTWRETWEQGDFPFLFVQLPGKGSPEATTWAILREAQANTLALKNTGMAVSIELGEKDEWHPKKKAPIGHRLALVARAQVYGEDVPSSGPVYRGMKIDDSKITLTFDRVYGGLVAKGEKLLGFKIAGADEEFVEADARIVADTVVVSSSDIVKPIAVRYAWANWPTCNLYNKAGLPAGTFRTDSFEE